MSSQLKVGQKEVYEIYLKRLTKRKRLRKPESGRPRTNTNEEMAEDVEELY